MLMQIFSRTPVWVWGLLCGLLALGFLQSRDRQVRRGALLALPIALLGLGLWSLLPAFKQLPLAAVLWAGALGVTTLVAQQMPPPAGARWLPDLQRLALPGGWLPMGLIVVIFSLRYATGVSMAMHPEWLSELRVQVPLALAFGGLGGLFLGRGRRLLGLTRAPLAVA